MITEFLSVSKQEFIYLLVEGAGTTFLFIDVTLKLRVIPEDTTFD